MGQLIHQLKPQHPGEVQTKPRGWAPKQKGPALWKEGPAPGQPGGQFGKAESSLPSSPQQARRSALGGQDFCFLDTSRV